VFKKYGVGGILDRGRDKGDILFDSGLSIIKDAIVTIPENILSLCDLIQSKLEDTEFSMLLKGEWSKDGFIIERNSYYIPKQRVSNTSVYFTEDVQSTKLKEFNVIMHTHPFKMTMFSGGDDSTINSNFECSLLYSEGNFTDAIINIKLDASTKLQIEPSINISKNIFMGEVDMSNIKKAEVKPQMDISLYPDLNVNSFHTPFKQSCNHYR